MSKVKIDYVLFFMLLVAAGLGAIAVVTKAQPVPAGTVTQEPTYPHRFPIRVSKILDGDTVEGVIDLPWHVSIRAQDGQGIRALGYDAWETSKRRRSVTVTDEEVLKGKKGRQDLTELFSGATVYVQSEGELRDPYGRILARLFVTKAGRTTDVAAWMEEHGNVRIPNAQCPTVPVD